MNDEKLELFAVVDEEKTFVGKDGKTHSSVTWYLVAGRVYQAIKYNDFGGHSTRNYLRLLPFKKVSAKAFREGFNSENL